MTLSARSAWGEEEMDLILISGEETFESTGSFLLTTVTRVGQPGEFARVV